MINVRNALKKAGLDARLILQIHDELIVEASEDAADKAAKILEREMENVVHLSVPLIAETSTGKSWLSVNRQAGRQAPAGITGSRPIAGRMLGLKFWTSGRYALAGLTDCRPIAGRSFDNKFFDDFICLCYQYGEGIFFRINSVSKSFGRQAAGRYAPAALRAAALLQDVCLGLNFGQAAGMHLRA